MQLYLIAILLQYGLSFCLIISSLSKRAAYFFELIT
jgi:hypothetical protein